MIYRYNLSVSCMVRDIPKFARDYLYRLVIPIAKKVGFFTNEYPCMVAIYKEKENCRVCLINTFI